MARSDAGLRKLGRSRVPSPLATLLGALLLISGLVPFVAVARGAVDYGDHRIPAGDALTRPMIVVGGGVTIEGETRAPLMVIGGDIASTGRARDNLVVIFGDLRLAPGSASEGDVVAVGGRIYRADDASVAGNVAGTELLWSGAAWRRGGDPAALLASRVRLGLLGAVGGMLLALAATTFLPWPLILSAATAQEQPARSALVGLTGLACIPLLIVPLALSLVGLPLALFLALALFVAWLVGLATAGLIVGQRVAALWTRDASLTAATMLGLVLLGALQAIPVVGGVLLVLIGGIGAGALALGITAGEVGRPIFSAEY